MSAFLKDILFENYCGFEHLYLNFLDESRPKQLALFFAPNGTGKCVSGSSYVVDEKRGQIKIKELFKDVSLSPQTWYDVEARIAVNGDWQNAKKIFYNGIHPTKKITTLSGYNIEGSLDNHQVLAVVGNCVAFKKISDLEKGDFVCISRRGVFPKKTQINSKIAELIGYLVAEGHWQKNSCNLFTNKDKEIINRFIDLSDAVIPEFYSKIHKHTNQDIYSIQFCRRKSINQLKKWGLSRLLSGEKIVPKAILGANKKSVCAFLRAFFEGDGGIDGPSAISCSSKSFMLMHQIHLLLLRLGIVSSLHSKNAKLNYTKRYPDGYLSWRITINGDNIFKFAEEVGFVSSRKKEALNNLVQQLIKSSRNPNKDVIPACLVKPMAILLKAKRHELPPVGNHSKYFSAADYRDTSNGLHCLQENYLNTVKRGVALSKIKACSNIISAGLDENIHSILESNFSWLGEDYFFDIVANIEDGEDDLFDVCVEHGHCYWSNGFINHNSSILNAIRLLSFPWQFQGRDVDLLFRKLTFHPDYNPIYAGFTNATDMRVSSTFLVEGEEKKVVIENSSAHVGVVTCELERRASYPSYSFFADADNPMNTARFQINSSCRDIFLDLAETIYNLRCEIPTGDLYDVEDFDRQTNEYVVFHTDFIIHKPNGTKVHFKNMSAGEKKIATMLAMLCSPLNRDNYDIFLIDNFSQHVYFKRHAIMLDKLLQCFPHKQFIATDHSGLLIEYVQQNYPQFAYDLENLVLNGRSQVPTL